MTSTRPKKHYNQIEAAFKRLNITLREGLDDTNTHLIQDSITNQFLKVEDVYGHLYLVRINGKLWPPFTRVDESYNLSELERNNFITNIIYNDENHGFQICKLDGMKQAFGMLSNEYYQKLLLSKVSNVMKNLHRTCRFKGTYPLQITINNAYGRLSKTNQKILLNVYQHILRILYVLNLDKENHVSSHNDLLPSSVYWKGNQISFVDWEYAGDNHRTYDLALFSIKSSLTPIQEKQLLLHYDGNNKFDLPYLFSLMKPVVSFLLMLWEITSARRTDQT